MSRAMIDVDTEKMIVRNALLRLFNPTMTSALLEGFYAASPGMCQFLDPDFVGSTSSDSERSQFPSPPPSPSALKLEDESVISEFSAPAPAFQFQVADFPDTYFAKDYFPKFIANVIGEQRFLPVELSEFNVSVSIRNKWADVTAEVLAPNTNLLRVVKDGALEISDLIFIDVSLKHGGFFTLHITPVDTTVVGSWTSPPFAIQSVKTHCNRKRKSRESQAPIQMMEPIRAPTKTLSSIAAPHQRRLDGFVVNDVKSFLAPPPPMMDVLDYGLSGGFFDMEADLADPMF